MAYITSHMNGFLKELTGSKAAELCLLHLFHYGESYGRAVVEDFRLSLLNVQAQLEKLEQAGLLVSKMSGRTRMYTWNPKSPFAKPFKEIVRIQYESLPLGERQRLFAKRRRPRSKGETGSKP
jgi:hypothetical protein